jgi:S-adenosylmethionine:tRNA ribosyltransferase-isomerase
VNDIAATFALPKALEAREPPEARGVARDEVKLMVAAGTEYSGPRITHATFRDLPAFLSPGDLLVVNVSATLAASLPAVNGAGQEIRVHYATRAPRLPESWAVVELRSADGSAPLARAETASPVTLPDGVELELVAPYTCGSRLWLARTTGGESVIEQLHRHGEPIRYGYVPRRWPLSDYQTVYARTPGSAEMPSAGRPFGSELLTRLTAAGVTIAPVTLHCGVSSPERHEPPFAEQYEVPEDTARLVQSARGAWRRVIAVGTTVVRALESATGADGHVQASSGWTKLFITPDRPVRAVDGLITGWHEPEASHLQLLEAVAGRELLERSYAEAVRHDYLWHEFGDSHLLLP